MALPSSPAERSRATARSAIISAGSACSFEANAHLFKQGEVADSILLIVTGRVKIVHEVADERQTVLGVRGPGDLIGEFAAITRAARTAEVVALQPVTGYAVDSATFIHLLIQDSGTMLDVMRGIIAKVGEADRRRLDFARLTVERRVARFLTEIVDPAGRLPEAMTVPLSQADLATLVGTTRESCAVAIRNMRGAGLVETDRCAIRVLDLDRLRLLAQTQAHRRKSRRRE